MGIKDMGKAIITTGAGLVGPLHGMGAVLLTETMDFFYQSYIGIKRDKAQKFYDEFQKWLISNLKDIDEKFLEEPYFAEILEIIITKASSSSSERKIKIFQKILQERVMAKKSNDMSRTYLDIVEKITEEQLELLKITYDFNVKDSIRYMEKEEILSKVSFAEKFSLYATDLISKGILQQNSLGGEPKALRITSLGVGLIDFISGRN